MFNPSLPPIKAHQGSILGSGFWFVLTLGVFWVGSNSRIFCGGPARHLVRPVSALDASSRSAPPPPPTSRQLRVDPRCLLGVVHAEILICLGGEFAGEEGMYYQVTCSEFLVGGFKPIDNSNIVMHGPDFGIIGKPAEKDPPHRVTILRNVQRRRHSVTV